jgi:hypothetical protein
LLPRGRDLVLASFHEFPESVWLGISTMANGIAGDPSIGITYRRRGTDGEWLQLDFIGSDPALADTVEGQARLLRLLRAAAEATGPTHGEISYQTSSLGQLRSRIGGLGIICR